MKNYDLKIKCEKIKSYIDITRQNLISNRIKYKFFGILFDIENRDKLAPELIKEKDLYILKDPELIRSKLRNLIANNPKACNDYKTNSRKREKIFDFFVGRLHKEFNDLADPITVDTVVNVELTKLQ
jgi:Asp-tRNA(Asn)/Glu-tRNA(Gln) amidotransferase B subunit